MQPKVNKPPYYKGLDTFRGIGILWIMGCHYFLKSSFFRFGWVSLEFFFVLSGFLITQVLIYADKDENFFLNFYIRRVLRIFPAYYLLLIGFFIIVLFFDDGKHFTFYKQNIFYFIFYLQNWLFVFKGIAPEAHLNHLWSLAMEEQFYLLWPLAIYFIRDIKTLKKTLWLVIVFALAFRILVWYVYGSRFETYHCNTFARIDSIAFGCLLGCGFSFTGISTFLKRILILLCFTILIGGVAINGNTYFTNPIFCTLGYSAASFLSALFLEIFVTKKERFLLLRNNVILNFLGKISYSVYLVHMPLFLFFSAVSNFHNTLNGLICVLFSIIFGVLSFYLIELRFLNLKNRFSKKTTSAAVLHI